MPGSRPDIDRILDAIRAEARARGSKSGLGGYSAAGAEAATVVAAPAYGMPLLDARHVADFLCLPLDVFIVLAYRELLGREPDAGGAAHYQRALLQGRLARVEMLGRLRFSREGRERGVVLPGLAVAFVLASAYRVPLAGPALALLVRALALPAFLRDRSAIESAAAASGTWLKR